MASKVHTILKSALLMAIPVALAVASPSKAEAQVVVTAGVDVNAGVVVEPPAAFIATAAPEYYEGRPVYWYGNRWYYRNGARWAYYHSEPAYLSERRVAWGRPGYVYRGGYARGGYVVAPARGYYHPGPARYVYRR